MSDYSRQLRFWVRLADTLGWEVYLTGSGHWRFLPSNGGTPVTVASTGGGGNRSRENARASLRRAGLPV